MRNLLLIVFLCFILQPVSAEGWRIETRCVTQSDVPPPDWTGTILMSGWAGLHGISPSHDVPYVVRFGLFDGRVNSIFSPDGLWIAQEHTYITCWQCMRVEHVPDEIIVTSLTEPFSEYVIPIEEEWRSAAYDFRQITFLWYDSENLIFSNTLINPFSGEIVHPDFHTLPIGWFSPDKTRDVWMPDPFYSSNLTINDLNGDQVFKQREDITFFWDAWWLPDSSGFIVSTYNLRGSASRTYSDERFLLFDRDGNLFETFYETTAILEFTQSSRWHSLSADGRYFFFHGFRANRQTPVFYVADMVEKRIYDTCFENPIESGMASPDVNQLAFMQVDSDLIQIFDVDTWTIHPIAHHRGAILFWRET